MTRHELVDQAIAVVTEEAGGEAVMQHYSGPNGEPLRDTVGLARRIIGRLEVLKASAGADQGQGLVDTASGRMRLYLAWARAQASNTFLRLAITRAIHALDNDNPDLAMRVLLDAVQK